MLMRRSLLIVIVLLTVLAVIFAGRVSAGDPSQIEQVQTAQTIQGKPIDWWYRHTQQARKDANARRTTIVKQRREIVSLRKTLAYEPSVQESVALAALIYPNFSQARAWRIIKHESWMTRDPLHARNPSSTATGLYQFLTSTYASTPFGAAGFSIFSPYAQSLAAGWMHAHGRGCEWAIDC